MIWPLLFAGFGGWFLWVFVGLLGWFPCLGGFGVGFWVLGCWGCVCSGLDILSIRPRPTQLSSLLETAPALPFRLQHAPFGGPLVVVWFLVVGLLLVGCFCVVGCRFFAGRLLGAPLALHTADS